MPTIRREGGYGEEQLKSYASSLAEHQRLLEQCRIMERRAKNLAALYRKKYRETLAEQKKFAMAAQALQLDVESIIWSMETTQKQLQNRE